MPTSRRTILTGLASLGATAALPAWAQFDGAIRAQSDPYAQVDPYADPRNGFPSAQGPAKPVNGSVQQRNGIFDQGRGAFSQQDDEAEIGRAVRSFGPCIAEDGGPVANPRIQEAINAFITPFARVSDRSHLPWEARVARSNSINAWTVGGGKLSFNAGLIAMCDHPGELAAVVAHEMGHVDLGHVARGNRMNELLARMEAMGGMPLGNQPIDGLVPGLRPENVNTTLDVLRAGYSRSDEYEADEHSVEVMRRAGMHPGWAVSMMDKLARNGFARGHHLISELVLDHPQATARAANLRQKTQMNKPPAAGFVPPGWDVLKSAYPTLPKFRNT